MDAITARYNSLIEVLNSKQKKYIHFKSLGNFIQHLPEIEPEEDRRSCEKKIVDYLQVVEQSIDEVNSKFTTELYMNYIYPLGNAYKRIGFKKIIPIIYSLIFALGFDFFVGMIFFGFPYPLLTLLILISFYLRPKYYKSSRVFGMLY